ncbi:50S ribosomal protein L25/general stress protein Ctc [Eionea flava]
MSNEDFVLNAESRELTGKGASRRLRRESSKVPGIIYGGSKKPQMISLLQKDLVKHLENEAFYSHIISVNVDGAAQDVILKDLQRHPAKPTIYHVDLLRVSKTKKFTTRVPLHFINEEKSKGVKVQGGLVSHSISELEISCLPADLPEYIEVDLIDVEIGQIVHISDLDLPKGVESVQLSHGHDHDLPVATINKPKGASADDADSEESSEDAGEE